MPGCVTRFVLVLGMLAGTIGPGCQQRSGRPTTEATDPDPEQTATDRLRSMQEEAEATGRATWGHWGEQPDRYVTWSNHTNRLIPVYTFGVGLEAVKGAKSVYRDERRLRELYGRMPEGTLNPKADYFDQTDIASLMLTAADDGKRRIILVVFDGMDWTLTRTAAIAATNRVGYSEGRGTGLLFQDYAGTTTDFGLCVTSPANAGTRFDVDSQTILNPGGDKPGGYDASLGGATAWEPGENMRYLTGRDRNRPHAVTDSAASATSLCSGRKTYNDAINVAADGSRLEPVPRRLQARGFAVGVVSSVPVSHATPACAYANNVSRDDYQDIARDLLGEPSVANRRPLPGVEVLLGGGHGVTATSEADQGRNFEPGNKYVADSTLAAVDAANGGRYRVVTRTSGRRGAEILTEAVGDAKAGGARLFGFFGAAAGNLPYQTADGDFDPFTGPPAPGPETDRLRKKYRPTRTLSDEDVAENPTLADLTRAALELLWDRGPFWLMVEAGDVDWAAHANNIDNAIGAVKSGDEAFRAIVRWVERRDAWSDTIVIVTSDHGHAFVLTEPEAFTGMPVDRPVTAGERASH